MDVLSHGKDRHATISVLLGTAVTFIPAFEQVAICFHLGSVLFTAYFPFRARAFESRGHFKYVHLVAIITSLLFPAVLVGIQYGLGGFSRTVVPIYCLADAGSALVFAIIPTCVSTSIFLNLVMILLFKIFDISGWKLKVLQSHYDTVF